MHSRLTRRKTYFRLKDQRKNYWSSTTTLENHKQLGIVTKTPRICSCWMCRPRKHAGDTMQQRKAQARFTDELKTLSRIDRDDQNDRTDYAE